MNYTITGIGQDSHRFLKEGGEKPCIIGGVVFEDTPGMEADSDGDVFLHAICNAITSITHVPILGGKAIDMCKAGICNSTKYLETALEDLKGEIVHVALTLEGFKPRLQKRIDEMRANIASLLKIDVSSVGITVTSGDKLTAFGRGEGLMAYCVLSVNVEK